MEAHHFSSQTHDLESCPLREENRQLKLELEAIKDLAQKTEGERQQHCADLMAADERIEELEARIKELETTISKLEKVAPKWISVNGKLPPEGMVVIAFSPQGFFPAYYESYSHKDFAWWIDGNPVCNVTHWMKLPEPPTTEDSSVTEKEK